MSVTLTQAERSRLLRRLRAEAKTARHEDRTGGAAAGRKYGLHAPYRDLAGLSVVAALDGLDEAETVPSDLLPATVLFPPADVDLQQWALGFLEGMLSVWVEVAGDL